MKKETKKLIAAGIVMALSCGAWGSVSAQDCIRVTQGSESKTITGTDIVFDKKTVDAPENSKTSMYVANGKIDIKANVLSFTGVIPAKTQSGEVNWDGTAYTAGWMNGNGTINIDVEELRIGDKDHDDRGFRMQQSGNHLNIIADKIISYTGDGFINAQGDPGTSVANIGTADHRVGYFEAHTTFGKDDYGVAILQANEGNTVNLYADTAILDGSTNKNGGVIGTGGFGTVNVNTKDLTIDGNICGTYGGRNDPNKTASLNIVTDTLHMKGDVNIGSAGSGSSNFSRNTEVNIKANTSAVINGDINVAGNQSNKDNTNDSSTLNITFNGDSQINGVINVDGSEKAKDVTVNLGGKGDMTASKGVYNVNNNANVNFTGGQWAINEWNTAEGKDAGNAAVRSGASVDVNGASMTVGKLETEGTLNLKSKDGNAANISAKTLKGANGTVTTDSLENKIQAGTSEATGMTIKGSGNIADQMLAGKGTMQDLANVLTVDGKAAKDTKLKLASGDIAGEGFAETDENGNVKQSSIRNNVNTYNQAVSSMANLSLMTWRQENNDMNKRLGEVRASEGSQGIWARMARGQSKYGQQGIKNQYNYYQLGYDSKISDDWILGGAFTYTDGDSSYINGSGTNKHIGFAVYGSNLRDDGSFIDLIAKYAHMKNDFDVNGGVGSGDYSTNGLSFSAEYGKRFHQEGYWIEPQAELTYGRVSSVDFTTKNGASVHQDSMDSLVGRLGFSLGKDIKQGNVYVRASYLYDFQGDTSVTMSKGGAATPFKTDLGGGWWEFGVGTNLDLGHDTHFYLDVETTAGGDVDTPWQWNAGVRYSF